jgi:hypothetical protein
MLQSVNGRKVLQKLHWRKAELSGEPAPSREGHA